MKGFVKKGWLGKTGAFALGATAGSILALLSAPASGRMTRKRIGMKFRTLQNSTARQVKQTKKLLLKKAANLRHVAAGKLVSTRKWINQNVSNGSGKHSRRALTHA